MRREKKSQKSLLLTNQNNRTGKLSEEDVLRKTNSYSNGFAGGVSEVMVSVSFIENGILTKKDYLIYLFERSRFQFGNVPFFLCRDWEPAWTGPAGCRARSLPDIGTGTGRHH